jgi:hypothetical protein
MQKLWRAIRGAWWAVLAALAAVLGAVLAVLLTSRSCDGDGAERRPTPRGFESKARQEVERVRFEGEMERARVQATADAEKQALDKIEVVAEKDPAEARRWLADWLRGNL